MSRRSWLSALASASLAVVVAVPTAIPAQAVPRDLQAVREQVQDLQSKAEVATERYNEAQGRLRDIESDLAGLRAKLKRERAELAQVLGDVDSLARATYVSGGVDTSLQVLLADDPNQFLAQASALDQVANHQSAAVRRTQTTRLRLAQTEAAMEQKQKAAQGVRNEMRSAKQDADRELSAAEKVLNSLEAKERARLNAIEARERREARAEASRAARQVSTQRRPVSGVPPVSGRASSAVRYALAQVGDRYVRAATGPSAYDCSGLTLMAWRQAGVSLPHYSYAQYQRARKIPLSQAKPGDLVFYFGGGVRHVGLYIGNGKMVHAANPREGVTVTSVLGPWYNRYFSGIGRVA